jgi:RimJ/RimL family protein N-acetyltransferase
VIRHTLRWTKVIGLIATDNRRSIRVAEWLGERPAGDVALRERRLVMDALEERRWLGLG